jgi:CheY-like chemotaxis protein
MLFLSDRWAGCLVSVSVPLDARIQVRWYNRAMGEMCRESPQALLLRKGMYGPFTANLLHLHMMIAKRNPLEVSDDPSSTEFKSQRDLATFPSLSRFRDRPETILLVEDDPAMREMTRYMLCRSGFKVLLADSDSQAHEIWGRHADQIDLLLTDIMIPDHCTGIELAKQFKKQRPDLPVVYMSGFGREISAGETAFVEKSPFIQKPCSGGELIETVAFSLAVARSRKGDLD